MIQHFSEFGLLVLISTRKDSCNQISKCICCQIKKFLSLPSCWYLEMLSRQKFSSNSGKSVHLPSSTPALPCAKSRFVDDSCQFIGKKRAENSILSKKCHNLQNTQKYEKQEFSFLMKHLNTEMRFGSFLYLWPCIPFKSWAQSLFRWSFQ